MNGEDKKPRLKQPFSFHFEADIQGITESDGEVYTVTADVIFDQFRYVIERLQQKGVKISFRMIMTPSIEESTTKKAEG